MANVNFPFGFEPVRYSTGEQQVYSYLPVSPTNPVIGKGDPLERDVNGFLQPAAINSTTFVGIAEQFLAASAGGEIAYSPVENLIMRAQVDDANVAAQADLALEYEFTPGAPDPLTGRSTYQIRGSSKAANANFPLKLTQLSNTLTQLPPNAFGLNVVVECVANTGAFKGQGTVG